MGLGGNMATKEVLQGRLVYLTEQLINLNAAASVMNDIFKDVDLFDDERLELEIAIRQTRHELRGSK